MRTKANIWLLRPLFAVSFVLMFSGASSSVESSDDNGVPQIDRNCKQFKDLEFIVFDPHYVEARAQRIARARELGSQVIAREQAGQNTALSHQILSEIIWLISCTADFKRLDQRLDDLQSSLAHPEREKEGNEQNPDDGSGGKGYTEWFFKLDGLLSKSDSEATVRYTLIDRINSPEKLTDYLLSVSESDIGHSGIDHERP